MYKILAVFLAVLCITIILMPIGTLFNVLWWLLKKAFQVVAFIMLFVLGFIMGFLIITLWNL